MWDFNQFEFLMQFEAVNALINYYGNIGVSNFRDNDLSRFGHHVYII